MYTVYCVHSVSALLCIVVHVHTVLQHPSKANEQRGVLPLASCTHSIECVPVLCRGILLSERMSAPNDIYARRFAL